MALADNAGEIVSVTTVPLTDTPVTVNPLIVKSAVATVEESMFPENVKSIVVSDFTSLDIMDICLLDDIPSEIVIESERGMFLFEMVAIESEIVIESERDLCTPDEY